MQTPHINTGGLILERQPMRVTGWVSGVIFGICTAPRTGSVASCLSKKLRLLRPVSERWLGRRALRAREPPQGLLQLFERRVHFGGPAVALGELHPRAELGAEEREVPLHAADALPRQLLLQPPPRLGLEPHRHPAPLPSTP